MKVLGIDLGIASLGWALVENKKDNNKIIDAGVRIFTRAEQKDGSSLALPRREARGRRRSLRRKKGRMGAIKELFIKYLDLHRSDFFDPDESKFNTIYKEKNKKDVWLLRYEGISRQLEKKEMARVLSQIAKRRGYKSNSNVNKDNEGGKVLKALKENQEKMQEKNYLTVGQYLYHQRLEEKKEPLKFPKIRNSSRDYKQCVTRELLLDEVKRLFEKQREFSNLYSEELEKKYIDIAFYQRSIQSITDMVGVCTFEKGEKDKKGEKRAPKQSYSAERFVAISEINNNGTLLDEKYKKIKLTDLYPLQDILEIFHQKKTVKFSTIRKKLNIPENIKFEKVNYKKKNPEDIKFYELKGYHEIKSKLADFKDVFEKIFSVKSTFNEISVILSHEKDLEIIKTELKKLFMEVNNLTEDEKEQVIERLSTISFSAFNNLSLKAIDKLLPLLEKGKRYDEAAEVIYGHHSRLDGSKKKLLRNLNNDERYQLTNPVVKRAFSQFRKVINAVIKKHGSFDSMHIELSRDLKNSKKKRKEIEKGQKVYRDNKESAKKSFKERFNSEPREGELLKMSLWEEQNGICLYSFNSIGIDRLLEDGYIQVDHILPRSRSFDNSLNNKALVLTKCNQEKGDQTPFEWIGKSNKDSTEWYDFRTKLEGFKNLKRAKKNKLLNTTLSRKHGADLSEDDFQNEDSFISRNINDTRYISKFIKNFVEKNLQFEENYNITQKVKVRNGALISHLRYLWRIPDKNRGNDFHHVEDSIIIAFSTQSELQRMSKFSRINENYKYQSKERKEEIAKLGSKSPIKKEHLKEVIENVFPSYAPRRKISGPAHEETIYSGKTYEMKEKKDGKIKVKSLTGNSREYPVVLNKSRSVAIKDIMPRIDLFQNKKTKKYYIVPIYVHDFVKEKLPQLAIVQGKTKDGDKKPWLEMDENYLFITSIYKNDLIEVKTKEKILLGYFLGADSSSGNISIKVPQRGLTAKTKKDLVEKGVGIRYAKNISKYEISPLGERRLVKLPQKRLGTKKQLKWLKDKTSKNKK